MASISSLIAAFSYAAALCGIVPLFPWLAAFPRLLLVVGMAAGIWQSLRGAWPLKNWLLNVSVVPVFLFYAARFNASNVIQPVVNMLAVMLAVRLMGEKNVRHYMQMQVLSLFCLAASSLFDLSPLFLAYLALLLFLVAMLLVLLTFFAQDSRMALSRNDVRRVMSVGLFMPLISIPLLIFFFFLLPRTPIPLWNISGAPASRTSGFSDKVEPGFSQSMSESSALAFRAELPRQPLGQLYWRGTVFNRFEGTRWVRDGAIPKERLIYGPARISQSIYLEPSLSRSLIALDAPVSTTASRARSTMDGTIETLFSSNKRIIYKADSAVGDFLPVRGGINRNFYLQLPVSIPARISQLAENIRRQADSDSRRLELLEQFFRNGDYRYTMQGLPTGDHALEQFLFEKKRGHCEFFASAFAVLARSAGIPARLVGGYLGGEYNDLGGYYVVTDSMAHVWVEAYIDGKGWLRIDPSGFARNAGAVWGDSRRIGVMQRLRMLLDFAEYSWNRSVITYDFERQADAARGAVVRLQTLTFKRMWKTLLVPFAVLIFISFAVFVLAKRGILFPSHEERILRRFYRQLDRECGLRIPFGRQGLFELAALSGNERAGQFAAIYAGALYRDRALTDDEYEQLRQLLKAGFATPRSTLHSE